MIFSIDDADRRLLMDLVNDEIDRLSDMSDDELYPLTMEQLSCLLSKLEGTY